MNSNIYEEYLKNAPKIHFSPLQQHFPKEVCRYVQKNNLTQYVPLPYSDATSKVYEQYKFPFELYPYQKAWVDAFAGCDSAAMYFEVGAGKTSTATAAALYHRINYPGHVIVIMPPILIRQWDAWLKKIEGVESVLMYKGTPAKRKKLDLNHQFILMSMDIFKVDFDRIYEFFYDKNVTLIVDEAVSIKNPASQNHKCVWAFQNHDLSRLNARRKRTEVRVKAESSTKGSDSQAISALKDLLRNKYGSGKS